MINNGKRALAYTATITDIKSIEGYDKVEYGQVNNGWWCVISKNDNFKIGDICVYFEIDSLVPNTDPRFAFLEKKKYRIKTQKMCKVISQGLIMPKSAFKELNNIPVDTDVTDILGVKYYEPEDNFRKGKNGDPNAKYKAMGARHKNLAKRTWWKWLMKREWGKKFLFMFFGKKKDTSLKFPTHFEHIHKTDEERCENLPYILEDKSPLIVTEKLDGSSATYILERKKRNKFEFYVCSRNIRQRDERQETYHDTNVYWEMAFKYDIENKLKEYLNDHPELDYVSIQGEIVGESIQKNPLKLKGHDLFIFNFIKSDNGRLNSIAGKAIIDDWGMKFVPILDTNYILPNNLEEFKLYADEKSVVNSSVMREGIVLRNPETDFSFKNVSREYLMKH